MVRTALEWAEVAKGPFYGLAAWFIANVVACGDLQPVMKAQCGRSFVDNFARGYPC